MKFTLIPPQILRASYFSDKKACSSETLDKCHFNLYQQCAAFYRRYVLCIDSMYGALIKIDAFNQMFPWPLPFLGFCPGYHNNNV